MILNVGLSRLWQSHHLQSTISFKYSENLEKSVCTRSKAENPNLRTSGPSGSTALKQTWCQSWKSLHGLRNTFRNHCPWTQFTMSSINKSEALSHQQEAVYEPFEMDWSKVENVCGQTNKKCLNIFGSGRGTIRLVISTLFKSLHSWSYAFVPSKLTARTFGRAPSVLNEIRNSIFAYMLASFSREALHISARHC